MQLKTIQINLTQTEPIRAPVQSSLNSDLDLYWSNAVNLSLDQINVYSTSEAVQRSPVPSKKRLYWWM